MTTKLIDEIIEKILKEFWEFLIDMNNRFEAWVIDDIKPWYMKTYMRWLLEKHLQSLQSEEIEIINKLEDYLELRQSWDNTREENNIIVHIRGKIWKFRDWIKNQ